MNRFVKFKSIDDSQWKDWKWQQQNKLDSKKSITEYFPNLSSKSIQTYEKYIKKFKLGITPYILSLIELDENNNPLKDDPIWNQFCFFEYENDHNNINFDYDGTNENWETQKEMPTEILQHKYIDRAIIRIINECFGHCNYCYMALRILNKKNKASNFKEQWQKSIEYLKNTPQIRDVLISGGDPLLYRDEKIEMMLSDLRSIKSIKTIRLNTRVFSFNPYRITKNLLKIFKRYNLTALEIHTAHPKEINEIFDEKLKLFDEISFRPIILWRAPLLKGINDDYEVMKELFLKLYERRVIPYYLFHFAPFSLGRSKYGLSVERGRQLMKKLRREIPGPAFPRYTLFHIEGKHDIPIDTEETRTFFYTKREDTIIIKFLNWRGNWVEYPDIVT